MAVLSDLRAVLKDALERQGLDVFVYEADAGARPESPEQASLAELERADIVVLVVEHTYGEVTEREYDHARAREKPCLVYVRLGATPQDPEQTRFLAKLSGPRGVSSRDSFRDAVELAGKVAHDIQAWMVREFRRMSAATANQSISPRQSSQFAIDMGRLRTASSSGLETGGPADLLAWQLRLWFDALGYPLDGEASPAGRFVEFVVRIPERRRFRSVLVRAKDSEVRAPDIQDSRKTLEARAEVGRVDECWIVAPQRVSPAARAAAETDENIFVFTFDEVIEEDVDFTRYLEWLESEAKRERIDEFYVPLAASAKEVSADGEPVGTSTYEDVGAYVDQWLRDPSAEHVSLLGEFGTGKSWFALKCAVTLARQYREARRDHTPRPRIPLLVRLRDYARGFKDVGALLTDFVFREHAINVPTYTALEALNRLGRLLFIFDGFDEMAARVDRQKMTDNFWAMTEVLGPGSKAILTCRTEYFQFAQQARDVLGGKFRSSRARDTTDAARFQVVELEMFDRRRLEQIFSKKASPRQVQMVLANENLMDLAKRPVMVDLLLEAMPALDAERADLAQVYYLAVRRKMERDIGHHRTFTSMAEKMFFMCELSAEMLFTEQMKLHFKSFPDRIRQYFGSRAQVAEEDYWHHDLLSQTMLVRDDDGHYAPAHRSLLEFFVSYKLAAEVGAIRDEYLTALRSEGETGEDDEPATYRWSTFFAAEAAGRPRPAPLAAFTLDDDERLASGWGRAKVDGTLGTLIFLLCSEESIRATLASSGVTPPASSHYVSRLLSILGQQGRLGAVELEGALVHGLQLRDVDMSGARLARTQWLDGRISNVRLDGADLSGARFQKMELSDVTFVDGNLTAVELGGGTSVSATLRSGAWARSSCGDVVVVDSADGRFFVVDPQACVAVQVTPSFESSSWNSEVEGVVECPPFGRVDFGPRPSHVPGFGITAKWRNPVLSGDVELIYETRTLAPDVDEEIVVTLSRESRAELIRGRFVDASSRGERAPEDIFAAVSPSGRMLAGIRGSSAVSRAVVLHEHGKELSLAGSNVSWNSRGSFSPGESLIAFSEGQGSVGFWRTDTGVFVARFTVPIALVGAAVEGAVGLSPEVLQFSVVPPGGWPIEKPSPVSGPAAEV